MSGELIARREVKYLIPRWRVPAVRADLAALLTADRHNAPLRLGRGYRIRSLYFETHGLHSLREKLAGIFDRYKLRVRGYLPVDRSSPLTVEIKRKRGAQILKSRTRIDAEALDLLLEGRHGALLEKIPDDPVLRRFVAARASLGSAAPLMIDYTREAFRHASEHVYLRATLDSNFWVSANPQFFLDRPAGQPFATDQAILEVKTSGPAPDWLPMVARKHHLDPKALSKFAFAAWRTWARPRA